MWISFDQEKMRLKQLFNTSIGVSMIQTDIRRINARYPVTATITP